MAAARGAEERTAWRQPVDLIALCQRAGVELPHLFTASDQTRDWSDHVALSERLLGDDPTEIIDALTAAAREGASAADLGRALAYAAALRVARFGTANEHSDWETAHHVFTYTNAIHQALKRIDSARPDPAEAIAALARQRRRRHIQISGKIERHGAVEKTAYSNARAMRRRAWSPAT